MTKRMSDEESSQLYSGFTSPTVKMSGQVEDQMQATKPFSYDEPKTRIYRGPGASDDPAALPAEDPMQDPVVGWVVVMPGSPGAGASLKLGYGRNSIGRDPSERVCLNFGDSQLSRTGHAILTYDPRSRMFYLQSGTGPNLTYVETAGGTTPVLTPVTLERGNVILLGATKLKFWPFCGAEQAGFDWFNPDASQS
jgi:hypothetical protein